MKETKNFYKPWHAEKKEVIEQSDAEMAAMTDEERRIHNEQRNAEFEKIFEKAMRSKKYTLHLQIPFRKQLFARIVKLATKFAEDSGIDITYETTAEHGFLRLETDQLIIEDMRPDNRKIWKMLIRHADTFWVDHIEKYDDPAIQFTLFYSFKKNIRLSGIK